MLFPSYVFAIYIMTLPSAQGLHDNCHYWYIITSKLLVGSDDLHYLSGEAEKQGI